MPRHMRHLIKVISFSMHIVSVNVITDACRHGRRNCRKGQNIKYTDVMV